MKKIILILGLFIAFHSTNASGLYHGIDVDKIYSNGDWSNKEYIYQIINDYDLFLRLQQKFEKCPVELPDSINCYDMITMEVLQNFYNEFDVNWTDYMEFKKAAMNIYAVPTCQNKFLGSGGIMCNVDAQLYVAEVIRRYIKTLFSSINQVFDEHYSFLCDYK